MTPLPRILTTTADYWVFSKPSGWWTVPGRPMESPPPVLKDWIERELGTPWIVHRLDRGTSGVIVVARNADSHRTLSRIFLEREVEKTYRALVLGRPAWPTITVKQPLDGKAAFSEIRRLETFSGLVSEVLVHLRTGRQHQARRHLTDSGTPILGDPRYGRVMQVAAWPIPRLMLHAERLKIPEFSIDAVAELDQDYLQCREHFAQ